MEDILENRNIRTMNDTIDGQWIKERLTGRRGEKADLARALQITPERLSKILSGERNIQPNEFIPLLHFFGFEIFPVETTEEAMDLLSEAANSLNPDGLALARQQIAVLASNPALSRLPKSQKPES